MPRIILLTGRNAAGKGEAAKYLKNCYDFTHKEIRPFIQEIAVKTGISLDDRPAMIAFANEQRRKHGAGFFVMKLYYSLPVGQDTVIESIRNPGEIHAMKELIGEDVEVFSFDATQTIRYDRLRTRNDEFAKKLSLQQFQDQEISEERSDDPSKQNISACIELANFRFLNNTGLLDLYEQIDAAMTELYSKWQD